MVLRKLTLIALIAAYVSGGKHDVYSRYSVHGIKIDSSDDQQLLHALENTLDLDVWQHGSVGRRDALVMVPPEKLDAFFKELDDNKVTHYLHISDVASAFEEHDNEMIKYRQSRSNRMVFQDFPRYQEINDYMERIAEQYPSLVTLVNAGPSYENRDIKYLKISTTNFTDTSKPIYFMDAMIHAREWVTTPVALYSIHRLVEDLRTNDRDLLDSTDWIIMPLVNPDGYEYSHTDLRLWRRTRSYNPEISTTCYGADGNRNFNISFNTIGVSSDPCSDVYPGRGPFSEIETQYVRDILFEHLDRIQLYMNIHSHGNYVLFGYGDYTLPGNVGQLHHVGATFGAVVDALKLPEARYYLVGNSAMVLYGSSGSAQDYAQSIGVPFSYTLELPGYGRDFRVPPEFIDQINEETWQGIAATARLASIYYRSRFNA